MDRIVDLMLKDVAFGLIEKGISLEVTDAAKEWLAERGYDPLFGARPLRRVIQDHVEDRLSDAILQGMFGPGDTAKIDVDEDGEIKVEAESPVPVASA